MVGNRLGYSSSHPAIESVRPGRFYGKPMSPTAVLSVYCIFIVAASLLGGYLPQVMRMTHTRTQVIMSLVGGLMLGVSVLHLWPHAVAASGSIDLAAGWTLAGLLGMFFLIRAFDFHHHGPVEGDEGGDDCTGDGHSHDQSHGHDAHGVHRFSWAGMTFGLALHTMIDGVALGAAVLVDAQQPSSLPLYGLGVFLAIVLHKPLDAWSITSLMAASGWKTQSCQIVNMSFSLMVPVGAALVVAGAHNFTQGHSTFLGAMLGLSAGVFLCISLSDLLPELQFHSHDRLKLSVALLLGVAIAYLIGMVEPTHLHDHKTKSSIDAGDGASNGQKGSEATQ
jgi:zinc and cadmium transporter